MSMEAGAGRIYPTVRVSGGPRQRGRQYGEQARDRIAVSRAGYEEAFGRAAGWTWAQAVEAASVFGPEVEAAFPDYAEEMRGIADGAGLTYADVLTLNARTEVIWAATARMAAAQRSRFAAECTAFALLGHRTASGRPLVGQNWDWLVLGFDTLVVLEVEQPDEKPNFVTVVEAGLLAKATMNSAGVGVVTNALVSSADVGAPGIPYHVMLRALADRETMAEAIGTVVGNVRASSANYLVATADDLAVDLEAAPGDYRTVEALLPEEGVLLHTNHFLRPISGPADVSVYAMPDSLVRYQRADRAIKDAGDRIDQGSIRSLLCDHADYPSSVCCHPDPREQNADQWATVMSVVMDPAERTVWLASGNPCQFDFVELDEGALLSKPSRLAKHRLAL